mmetsp:Transcript_4754/g.9245  ORF Transcript_4754/g.9245 Transcript_4754/m.9245 type:complete len:248 (-) Transcript_4754:498-1241(-)
MHPCSNHVNSKLVHGFLEGASGNGRPRESLHHRGHVRGQHLAEILFQDKDVLRHFQHARVLVFDLLFGPVRLRLLKLKPVLLNSVAKFLCHHLAVFEHLLFVVFAFQLVDRLLYLQLLVSGFRRSASHLHVRFRFTINPGWTAQFHPRLQTLVRGTHQVQLIVVLAELEQMRHLVLDGTRLSWNRYSNIEPHGTLHHVKLETCWHLACWNRENDFSFRLKVELLRATTQLRRNRTIPFPKELLHHKV